MKTLSIIIVVLIAMLPTSLIGQPYNDTGLAGVVVRPSGPNVNDIIDHAVAARGGLAAWKKTRHLSFCETFHSKNSRGKLIQRGQIDKQLQRKGNLFYSRSDDLSDTTPAFVRALGPDGFWMQRSAIAVSDKLLGKAYQFESSRDFLLLFTPYLIKKKTTQKVYQGIKPVHGTKCYQLYIPQIRELKEFEGYEFLVSIDINTYYIKAVSFWKEKSSNKKTTVFLSGYKGYPVRWNKLNQILPTHYFIIFPDSSTLTVNLTNIEFGATQNKSRFIVDDNLNASFPHNKGRERDFSSRESLKRFYPRSTFLVSPEQRYYYSDMRSNEITR